MTELIIDNTIATIVCTFAGALAGFLLSQLKTLGKKSRAERVILKTLARQFLVESRDEYVGKKVITLEKYHQLSEIHEAYADLDGNGEGSRAWRDIEAQGYEVIDMPLDAAKC